MDAAVCSVTLFFLKEREKRARERESEREREKTHKHKRVGVDLEENGDEIYSVESLERKEAIYRQN